MKLHGIAPSNYYNVAKIGLLEKGLPFMEVRAMPSQEEAFLAISPMGKIPVLETDDGQFLSESQAILAYLELAYPNPPLYPADAMAAGRAQQIHAIIDCYLDPPARRMISPAFFGGSATAEEVDASEKDIARVFAGLSRIVAFDPFIAGDSFTHADIAAFCTFGLAREVMLIMKRPDPTEALPGWKACYKMLRERPTFKRAAEERRRAVEAIQAKNS